MAVVPETEQIVEFLATWVDAEGAPVALSHPASLPMETSRRRLLGEARALLVDVPWSAVLHFRKAARVRVTAGPAATIFQVDGNTARPVRAAADTWVAAEGGGLAAYLTAVEPEELPQQAAEGLPPRRGQPLLGGRAGRCSRGRPASSSTCRLGSTGAGDPWATGSSPRCDRGASPGPHRSRLGPPSAPCRSATAPNGPARGSDFGAPSCRCGRFLCRTFGGGRRGACNGCGGFAQPASAQAPCDADRPSRAEPRQQAVGQRTRLCCPRGIPSTAEPASGRCRSCREQRCARARPSGIPGGRQLDGSLCHGRYLWASTASFPIWPPSLPTPGRMVTTRATSFCKAGRLGA